MKDRLTRRQVEVFRFIQAILQAQGVPPSIREIAKHFGFASPSSAEKHLVALEQKGLIRRHRRLARNIEVVATDASQSHRTGDEGIPILGRVPAGSPILAAENFAGFLSLRDAFGDLDGLFALRVTGDSMVNVGILGGDYVVVRHQAGISNGEIGVAYLGEDCEATVKRIFFEKECIRLQPENDALSPTLVPRDDPHFRLGGKVVGFLKRF